MSRLDNCVFDSRLVKAQLFPSRSTGRESFRPSVKAFQETHVKDPFPTHTLSVTHSHVIHLHKSTAAAAPPQSSVINQPFRVLCKFPHPPLTSGRALSSIHHFAPHRSPID